MPKKLLKSMEEGVEYALRLLAARDYSLEGLRQKMRGKGLGDGEAGEILDKLKSRGLIDDRRYARRLAVFYTREKLWGPQKVAHKLLQKGITLDLTRKVIDEHEVDSSSRDRLQKVLRLKLKGKGWDEMVPQEKSRLTNYLRQRGFLWEDIMEALQEAGGSAEE